MTKAICTLFFIGIISNGLLSQTHSFASKDKSVFQYAKTVKKKMGDGYNVVYFDSIGYENFAATENFKKNLKSVIYGYFIDDTILIRAKSLSQEVPSCTGTMNKEINEMDLIFESQDSAESSRLFTSGHLLPLFQNEFSASKKGSKKLVLLYSISQNKRFKSFFQKAKKSCDEKNIELVVLTLDPVCWLSTAQQL